MPNLQVINRDIHALKCAGEATYRSGARRRGGTRPTTGSNCKARYFFSNAGLP